MKLIWTGLTAAAFVAVLAMPAFAKAGGVTGRLVGTACYSKDTANTGHEHKAMGATCAQDCAKKGTPVALLTSDGKVWHRVERTLVRFRLEIAALLEQGWHCDVGIQYE